MLDALQHILLAVPDLAGGVRSVAALLGRGPSWRGELRAEGLSEVLFRLENTSVRLLAPGDEAAGGGETARGGAWLRERLEERGPGLLGLAFATRDLEACRARLAERGLEPGASEPGLGRDLESGAFRQWRWLSLPSKRTRGVRLFAMEARWPEGAVPRAPALCDPPAAVAALDHCVIRTAEPDAASRLYGEGLGLRLALDRSFPQWGARLLFFRVGGVTVELAAGLGRDASGGDAPRPDTDELWGLSWRVPDADAARERLAAAGFDVSSVRAGRRPGTRVLTVRSGTFGIPTLVLEPPAEPS